MKDEWNLIRSYKRNELHSYWTGALLGDEWRVETHVRGSTLSC
jgi:hypothetical protein